MWRGAINKRRLLFIAFFDASIDKINIEKKTHECLLYKFDIIKILEN